MFGEALAFLTPLRESLSATTLPLWDRLGGGGGGVVAPRPCCGWWRGGAATSRRPTAAYDLTSGRAPPLRTTASAATPATEPSRKASATRPSVATTEPARDPCVDARRPCSSRPKPSYGSRLPSPSPRAPGRLASFASSGRVLGVALDVQPGGTPSFVRVGLTKGPIMMRRLPVSSAVPPPRVQERPERDGTATCPLAQTVAVSACLRMGGAVHDQHAKKERARVVDEPCAHRPSHRPRARKL